MVETEVYKDTKVDNLSSIFTGDNDYKLIIPATQRNYSWSDNANVKKLWDDLLLNFSENRDTFGTDPENHYEYLLGPMVLIKNPGSPSHELEIFDGQQRTATLTLLLCIIRDLIIEDNMIKLKTNKPRDISKLLDIMKSVETFEEEEDGEIRHKYWRLMMNNLDKEFFESIVLPYEKNATEDPYIENDEDPYRRISLKIYKCKQDLKKHNKEKTFSGQPSQVLLRKAYLKLYEQIQNALITDFEIDEAQVLETITTFREESEKAIDEELRKPPVSGASSNIDGIKPDFFNDHKTGYDYYAGYLKEGSFSHHKFWDATTEAEINADYVVYKTATENYNQNNPTKPRKIKSFSDWIKKKFVDKGKECCSTKQGYETKKFTEIRKEKMTSLYDSKTLNRKQESLKVLKGSFFNNQLTKYLFLVKISVLDYEVANVVFERLNDTGIPLSKSNLVKNHIIALFPAAERIAKGAEWDDIIIKTKNADKFLKESLQSRGILDPLTNKKEFQKYDIGHAKTVKPDDAHLYKIIKSMNPNSGTKEEKIQTATDYIEMLKTDILYSQILDDPLKYFRNPTATQQNRFADAKLALIDLQKLNPVHIRLPILTAFRKWKTPMEEAYESDAFVLLVKFLVSFFFRYKTIRDQNPEILLKWMLKACEFIQNGNDKDADVQKIIKVLLQFDDELDFKTELRSTLAEPKENAKFILEHLTKMLGNKDDEIVIANGLEVEHIFPQNEKPDDWKCFMDDYEAYDKDLNPDELSEELLNIMPHPDQFTDRLGNLTLLSSPKNKELSNLSFPEKLNHESGYKKSQLKINSETVVKVEDTDTQRTDWTSLGILKREEYLTNEIIEMWNLPRLYCTNHQCSGYKKSTKRTKVDFHEDESSKLQDVSNCVCEEKNGTQTACGNSLEVVWPKNNAIEYRAPREYTSDSDSRRANN
jgi:uncharacterized protein with ParB-like and HNH nuclease domain